MKSKFYKAAEELGIDILHYDSYRYEGCQEYDITIADEKSYTFMFREAIELGASQEAKDRLIELFKETCIERKNPCNN